MLYISIAKTGRMIWETGRLKSPPTELFRIGYSSGLTAFSRQMPLFARPYFPGRINSYSGSDEKLYSYMKLSAELGQSLCWNKSVQDFEKRGMSQAAAPAAWVSLSPFLFPSPSRYYSCGPQVSLHSLVNRFSLPLSCGHLPDSNHSLSRQVWPGLQHLTAQSVHAEWHGASAGHPEPEFLLLPTQYQPAGEITRMTGRFSRSSFWICHWPQKEMANILLNTCP